MQAGDRLANGAMVILHKGNIVLAVWEKAHWTEWVTWQMNDNHDTYHGHYFYDIRDAVTDFFKRRIIHV